MSRKKVSLPRRHKAVGWAGAVVEDVGPKGSRSFRHVALRQSRRSFWQLITKAHSIISIISICFSQIQSYDSTWLIYLLPRLALMFPSVFRQQASAK